VYADRVPRPVTLRLELLGGFRVFINDRPAARQTTARQRQLLACLALHADAPMARQQVAGQLWPESTDAQALTNLRRELHHLRESWPELDAAVQAGSRTLAWRPGSVEIDVHLFERAASLGEQGEAEALEEAARRFRGDLLPDCADEWIQGARERLRQRAISVLSRLVDLRQREQATGGAIEPAQQLLQLDPLNEPAWCALMRCHARRGERATALHLYQQCASLLKQELNVQPSAAMRRTYREILDLDEPEAAAALAAPPAPVYPLVGRQREWKALRRAWQATRAGRRQLLVIRGEAGIGKTRLAEELVDWCRSRGCAVATARCYGSDRGLAYAPVAAWLRHDAIRGASASLDGVWLAEVSRLLPELLHMRPDVAAPPSELENWQRFRLFEALSRIFDGLAPLLLVMDDLQWADADTLDWLHFFLRSTVETPCLIVATIRTEEESDNRALGSLLQDMERIERLTTVPLGPLDLAATAQLAAHVAEHPLDATEGARTFHQTEGHPLFIIEQGRMETGGGEGEALSPRVQAVVAARLARLSDEARSVAECAAAIGRDFTFDILAQVSDLEEDAVVRAVDELWRRQIVRVQADERWDFGHDRIREVAYHSIGPARRRLIHRRIAQALERSFGADLDGVSGSIAAHLERGGQAARSVPYLERAAQVAMRVSAYEEAIRCLTHALSLVDRMPAGGDRNERELMLRAALSGSLTSARGYAAPEVQQNLERLVTLSSSERPGDVPVRWLWGLWTVHYMLGDLKSARALSEQAVAASRQDPSTRCEAHHAMGGSLTSVGELEAARGHFEGALAEYDERRPQRSAFGSDLGVFTHGWYAHALWLLGEPDAARAHAEEAIALARRLDHVYSETLALAYGALTYQLRGDLARVSECARAVIGHSERYGFAYYIDWATVLLGWARGREGDAREGIALIEGAIERLDRQRAQARRPYYLSLLAETYASAGSPDRAESLLDTAVAKAIAQGETWWLPELYRQKALLAPATDREGLLRLAIDTARAHGSRSLHDRIVASLTPEEGLSPRTPARTLHERLLS
jgi:DNA-binding SARP family transcriptional activator/predicted ATPase